jgi:hypothetical protein
VTDNDSARDLAQSEEFRQAALGDEDKDRTLNLLDLIEMERSYRTGELALPDDESISHPDEDANL